MAINTLNVTGTTTYPTSTSPSGLTYSGSMYFGGGSTSYSSISNSGRFNLDSFNFTVEAWVFVTTLNALNVIVGSASSTTTDYAWALGINKSTTTNIQFTSYTGFGQTVYLNNLSNNVTINTNTWYHVAVTRAATTMTFYLNGVSVGTATLTTGQLLGLTSQALVLGNSNTALASNYVNGYISNVRVIRGYSVYTGNFTPSTGPLSNTQNSGTNIIKLGSGATPTLGNSVYFNGTTDYMKAPGSVTSMYSNDFTIETYYYPTSFAAVTTLFGQYTAATTNLGYWNVQITTGGIITVYYNGSTNFTASTAILLNEWVHIALVRYSGTITLYVNGVSYGTVSFSSQFGLTSVTSPLYIGATQLSGPTQYAVGYFSNLRITKGLAVYTGAFTVPSSTLSATQTSGTNIQAITTQTILLLYQNSLYIDNSGNGINITALGNPTYSPVFSPSYFTYPTPASGNSVYFNGTSSYLSLTQPSSTTANFTVEMWVYPTSITANGYLLSTSTTAANCYHLWIAATTGAVTLAMDSATASITSGSPSYAKLNAWTHIAIVRNSNTVTMYVNGTAQATTTSKSTQFGDTGILNVGRYLPTPGSYFTGYITNLRYVYGTAVYTSYFTAPYATPLTAITNTTLLLAQSTITQDNSTNNVTVTNNSAILSTYTNPYTMMQLPVLLTAQSGSSGVARDNSIYAAAVTNNAVAYSNYQAIVSPFGITPSLLLAQSVNSLYNDNALYNLSLSATTSAAFSPTIMPYVTPFANNNAIAFNGSSQYITGTNLVNTFGGDFTIEFFMMAPPQTASVFSLIVGKNAAWSNSYNNNYYIGCSATGGSVRTTAQTLIIANYQTNTSSPIYVGTTVICDSKWHHVAIVRISNIVTVYVDGVADTGSVGTYNSFTNTGVWDFSNYTIGSNANDGGSTVAQLAYNGLLSNMRMINGTGIYTGNFTKPSSNLSTNQTSGTNISTFAPSVPSTTGYSWVYNNVASSYITITPAPTLNFGFNNYTIEFWHYLNYRNTTSTTPCFFSNYNSFTTGGLSMFAGHSSSSLTKYQIAFNGMTFPYNGLVSNSNIIYGKWTHIAVVRNNGTVYLYINGVLDSSSGLGNYNVFSTNNTWYIGAAGDNAALSYMSGLISNFRVVNGVAVYTGNFTIPTTGLSITQSSSTNISSISNTALSNPMGGAVYYSGAGSSGYQSITGAFILSPIITNLTVEGWVFLITMPTANTWTTGVSVLLGTDSASLTTGVHFVIGALNLFIVVTNTQYGGFTHNMTAGNWYHLAYVINNNVITFYVNGVAIGSTASIPSTYASTTTYIATAAATASYGLNGYISNLRVLKNVALYINNFTPSTNPLTNTQLSVTNNNLVGAGYTSLLALQNSTTSDASNNLFLLTATGGPSVNYKIYPNFTATNGSSGYFSNAYSLVSSITAPSTSSIQGTGTFTVECWIYPLAFFTSYQVILTNDTANGLMPFGINPNGTIFYGYSGYSVQGTTTTSVTFNAWNHLALVRNGTTGVITLYINGVSGYTGTNTTSYVLGITRIGTDAAGANYPYTGYISNIRFVNNTAVYTSNFTVPTSALSTTQSVNSNGNPSAALAVNTYAASLNGTSQYVIINPSSGTHQMSTANFTMEFYIYFNSFSTSPTIFGATNWVNISVSSAGAPTYSLSSTGSSYDIASSVSFGSTLLLSTWYHFALVRNGTAITPYINGVAGTATTSSAALFSSTTNLTIGYITAYHNGYISNVRITKGVAVYTGTFTPPTTALTTTQNAGVNITQIVAPTNSVGNYGLVFTTSTVNPNYITVPGTPLVFGTNNFTIECWVFLPSLSVATIIDNTSIAGANATSNYAIGQWTLYLTVAGMLTFLYATNSSTTASVASTTAVTAATWTHLAVVRTSTATSGFVIYVNGVAGVTGTVSASLGLNTTGSIGVNTSAKNNTMNGIISNLRITNIAVYTGAFTVPTGPLTVTQSSGTNISAITGTQVALLTAQNATIIDNSTFAYSLTNYNNVAIGSSYGLFGNNVGVTLLTLQNNTFVDNSYASLIVSSSTTKPLLVPAPGLMGTSLVSLLSLQNSLTNDAGAYNLTLTSNGLTQLAITSPFVQPNGLSIGFLGSSQFINAPSNSAFTFGTSDFTIEGWIYISANTFTGTLYDGRTASNTIAPQIYINFSTVYYAVGGTVVITGATINAITWYHIALVRISGITKLYINGIQSGSSYSDSNSYVIGSPYFGTGYNSSYPLNGYISNVRVINGIGAYKSTFTVPTTVLSTTVSSNTTTRALTALPSNYNSGYFDGASFLSIASSFYLQLGGLPFTIEAWVYLTNLPTTGVVYTICQKGYSTGTNIEYSFGIDNLNGNYRIVHGYTTSGSNTTTFNSNPINITTGVWYHVAVTRNSNTVAFYLNGTPVTVIGNLTNQTYYTSTGALTIGSIIGGASYFNGFISNFRIVNGVVYTSQFTPSTTGLTSTQNTNTNGTPSIAIGPISSTGYYGYFNPTGSSSQYASIPGNGYFFGTSPFTIECYAYITSISANTVLIDNWINATGSFLIGQWQLYVASTGAIVFNYGASASSNSSLTSTTLININTWYHIAVVRTSTAANGTAIYINGVSGVTGTVSQGIGSAPVSSLGIQTNGKTSPLVGVVTNIRLTAGVAVYTGTFTPPTGPLTATQTTGTNIAAISAPTTTNGYYMLALSGLTTQYLSLPGTPFVFGTSPFTIEFWIFINNVNSVTTVIDNFVTGGSGSYTVNQWQVNIGTGGSFNGITQFVYATSTSAVTTVTGPTINAAVWAHVAIVRTSTAASGFNIYVNGTGGTASTVSQSIGVNATSSIGIMTYNKTQPATCFISNIRVTNIAVYTGNFTVPTGPLAATQSSGTNISAISGTQVALLTAQSSTIIDNSTFAYTITNTGSVVPSVVYSLFSNYGVTLLTAQNSTNIDSSINNFTVTNVGSLAISPVAGILGQSITQLLMLQSSVVTSDSSINNFTATVTGTTTAEKTFSAFGSGSYNVPSLLTAQSTANSDNSTNQLVITTNSPYTIGTVQGYSALFNGSTDYLTILNNASLQLGSSNWTIEAWVYLTSFGNSGTWSTIAQKGRYVNGDEEFAFYIKNTSGVYNIGLEISTTGSNYTDYLSSALGVNPLNVWHHYAISVSGSVASFWFDGVSVGTSSIGTLYSGTGIFSIGSNNNGSNGLLGGNISNLRLIKGTALYSTAFTPSTTQLTAITNTVLLTAQSSSIKDNSTNAFVITTIGSPIVTTYSPFTNSSSVTYTFPYETSQTPYGSFSPVSLLIAQSNVLLSDTANYYTPYMTQSGTAIPLNLASGPFNNDTTLLTFQGPLISDYSNNRTQLTVVGAGVSPTDTNPFVAPRVVTGFLTNTGGPSDTSFANAVIANSATAPTANMMINPFTVSSSMVSVLMGQNSNTLSDGSINNWLFANANTAFTTSNLSPFGTYYSNGIISLNTGFINNSYTTANIVVIAGDGVTTNTYSVNVTSTANALYANRAVIDTGYSSNISSSYVTINDVANSNVAESVTNVTFTSTITRATIDSGFGNIYSGNIFIGDIANSNLAESSNVVISNVQLPRVNDVLGTSNVYAPSPNGGIALYPTYSYTDGVPITAANVSNSAGSGTYGMNTQIWYQT